MKRCFYILFLFRQNCTYSLLYAVIEILDPCLVKYCGNGEECVVIKGKAVCICQRQCPKIRKVICGSDGKLYSNHCELHRAACLTAKPLFVDHSFSCSTNLGKYFIIYAKQKYSFVNGAFGEFHFNCYCVECIYMYISKIIMKSFVSPISYFLSHLIFHWFRTSVLGWKWVQTYVGIFVQGICHCNCWLTIFDMTESASVWKPNRKIIKWKQRQK